MTLNYLRRLYRAFYHLERVEAEVAAWLEERPYKSWSDFDVDTNYKLLWVEVLKPPPAQLGLVIGDCLHGLRAALDNLVYELALAHVGIDPMPEGRARLLEFPIFGNRAMDDRECRNKIGCIDPRAQAIIKGLQPHNLGDAASTDPLWWLQRLSNIDKHRLPHVVLFVPLSIPYAAVGATSPWEIEPIWGPTERRAPIARFPAIGYDGEEADVEFDPSFSVAFGQRTPKEIPRVPVTHVLRKIVSHIGFNVVTPLAPYLTRIPIVHVGQDYSLLPSRG